ncbi:MAG: MFS transporter [Legionellales bacterium]|jgi:MFS family permease|nr:MFS transporter [Legionellales bacterium]|tara:strand:- start:5139 stop:6824 length:1686 start_codon:yes stop_codon:yes gene_type:complete
MLDILSKKHIVAKEGFNRWLIAPAALGIHLCIGSVYAWSLFNPALIKRLGVVTSAADDWTLKSVVWIFTVAIVFLGLAAAVGGKWLEKVGPRMVGTVSAICWGGGFLVGGIGILTGKLWLLYLGYGVIGGCGLGLGYVSPVGTLIRWFPDRRGMATGIAIMGFGGGAMIAKFMIEPFIKLYYKAPDYLGNIDAVELITKEGRRLVEIAGEFQEVVVVGAKDLAGMYVPGPEGVYLVGTGTVGVAQAFFTLGAIYFVIMMCAAFGYRVPPEGWKPKGWVPPSEDKQKSMITQNHVHIDEALKTRQFYQLWVILCFNVTAGIGVLGVAKTMMSEIFGSTLPGIVDAAFASTYVLMISLFNMIGRIFWASSSDYIGRKNTYWIFFAVGIILYCSIPYTAQQVSVNPSVVWLIYFYAATMLIFTMYGGGFATIPAYLADIFGTKYVGGIHGRLLTAWASAGVFGPLAITSLREISVNNAINDLVEKINPVTFQEKFGASIDQLEELVSAKTVTINKLMEIAPYGTVDPTSSLYNTTMYLMAVVLFVALIMNATMRPVDPKHHMKE